MEKPTLLYTASSMIERDALLAHLKNNLVDAQSPARDMSRKYTENTVDLSLGGYSVFFDGFKIFIQERQQNEAQKALHEFLEVQSISDLPKIEKNGSYLNKFYFFGIASVFVPIVPVFLGTYYLYKAIMAKEKIKKSYFIVSLCFYIVSLSSIYIFEDFFRDFIMSLL